MPAEMTNGNLTKYLNVSGYRFVQLEDLPELKIDMLAGLKETGVFGTVLIAAEGINVALFGSAESIAGARRWFDQDERFAGLWLKESWSELASFSKLKVRVRPEIITFDGGKTDAAAGREHAPAISPQTLQKWLDEGRDLVLLDTRNNYEIRSGTFTDAVDVDISHFRKFPEAVNKAIASGELPVDKPIITFCTGGIRCEKAAPMLAAAGVREVYQIDGDDRVEISPQLTETGASLCRRCHSAVAEGDSCQCQSGSLSAADTV